MGLGGCRLLHGILIYISSFETGDVGDTAAKNALPTLWDGAALEAYRKGGLYRDLWDPVAPPFLASGTRTGG